VTEQSCFELLQIALFYFSAYLLRLVKPESVHAFTVVNGFRLVSYCMLLKVTEAH